MIYLRSDRQCKAEVLAVSATQVLIDAFWPAAKHDHHRFLVVNGMARNIVNVPKEYFERRYGPLAN